MISGKPNVGMTLNGALGGLVGITAGCAFVSPVSAIIIGLLAGILVAVSVEVIDKVFHIDDPVGAVSVHGICGIFGTLAIGLFGETAYGAGANGLFFGGGFELLGIQAVGAFSVVGWVVVTAGILFAVIKRTVGLRVTPEEERIGLDIGEHGIESYSGFQIFSNM